MAAVVIIEAGHEAFQHRSSVAFDGQTAHARARVRALKL
jgi:hypothetical protein